MPKIIGHFLIQRSLKNRLRELLRQSIGPVRESPCSTAIRNNSFAATSSAEGFALFFFAASSVVITAPSPPDPCPRCQAKNTKFRTMPTHLLATGQKKKPWARAMASFEDHRLLADLRDVAVSTRWGSSGSHAAPTRSASLCAGVAADEFGTWLDQHVNRSVGRARSNRPLSWKGGIFVDQ